MFRHFVFHGKLAKNQNRNIIQSFKLAFAAKYVTVTVRNTANFSQQTKLSASAMLPAEANSIHVTEILISFI